MKTSRVRKDTGPGQIIKQFITSFGNYAMYTNVLNSKCKTVFLLFSFYISPLDIFYHLAKKCSDLMEIEFFVLTKSFLQHSNKCQMLCIGDSHWLLPCQLIYLINIHQVIRGSVEL